MQDAFDGDWEAANQTAAALLICNTSVASTPYMRSALSECGCARPENLKEAMIINPRGF